MRITVNPNDKDYKPPEQLRNVKIYLDGVEQRDVLIADEEQSIIVKAKRDENGHFVINNDEIIYETLCGVVELEGAQ